MYLQYDYVQTFIDIPHNSSVVNRSRNQEVSIPGPADVIDIFYVSPKNNEIIFNGNEHYIF